MATKPNLTPPKKPINAFFHFQQYNKSEIVQANPDKSMSEIAKLLGQAYKQLPRMEKEMYDDLAAADKERYKRECQAYTEKWKIDPTKRKKSLPTDDDEEYQEDPPKRVKGVKVKEAKKDIREEENKIEAESIPHPNHHSLYLPRNSLNHFCFVEMNESTEEETLVTAMDTLNDIVNSIEVARQEDKEDIESDKRNDETKDTLNKGPEDADLRSSQVKNKKLKSLKNWVKTRNSESSKIIGMIVPRVLNYVQSHLIFRSFGDSISRNSLNPLFIRAALDEESTGYHLSEDS